MKRVLCMIPLAILATTAFAQEQPLRVSDMLDLEEKVMMKKMTEDLNKSNATAAPPPLPVVVSAKAPEIVYPTETLAVYGTSTTYYEGQLSLGGRTYTVRNGTPVQGYTVTAIGPQGIELTRLMPHKKRGKSHQGQPERQVTFAPLAAH